MKKLLFVLAIFYFFLLNFEFANAQVPSYVPTNGLVGYWPFNGNANDESGNGNNGVVNGATLTSDRNGNVGKAYSFNGTNVITISNNASLNFQTNNTMSVSFWFKTDTNQLYRTCLIQKQTGEGSSQVGYDLGIDNGGYIGARSGINLRSRNGVSNQWGSASSDTSINFTSNRWFHVVMTYSNGTGVCYINGLLNSVITNQTGIIGDNTNPLLFGSSVFTAITSKNYIGQLDDIAIYNRALTPQEITQLYTGQVIPSYVPTNGLVGYWPFNGNANDASGNGNNGTVNGATLTTDRFGNVGRAYSFNGSTGNINNINLGYDTSICLKPNKPLSISFWYLANSDGAIISKYQNGDAGQSTIYIGESSTALGVLAVGGNGTASFPTCNTNINTWKNIVITYLGGNATVFVNGVINCTMSFPINATTSNLPLLVGSTNCPLNDPNCNWFKGKIDDIAIYNRVITATEIQNLYNASAPTSCIANITNNDTTICRGASVTLNAAAVNSASVTDINGNVYPTVNIGSQTWMQKNLNVSKYKNGDIIPQVTDPTQWANLTTGAWCWYNNDSATYAATYGKLYNWYAVNDPRGLAPDGWHVPTQNEWNQAIQWIDNLADTNCINCSQSKSAGGSLKEVGISHWTTPNYGASNASGFTGLAAGGRNQLGSFYYFGINGVWWTSSSYSNNNAIDHYVIYDTTKEFTGAGYKVEGFSVRAIRNTPTYLWSTGATTSSITVSPLVTTTYYCTVSDGVNTCRDSVKITVGATAVPSAPTAITGATDVCGYFSSITSATSNTVTYTAATVSTASSYTWTVPAGVTIVSGQGTNSITVTFAYSFVSGAIAVNSVNVCGASTAARSLTVYKRVAAAPALIQKEFSPTSIVAVTNVTGLVTETYRIKKVLYATSYNWSMNQGTSATITHINTPGVNDTAVIVTFASCFLKDTLSVKAVTPCSISAAKTAILSANTTPTTVAGIGTAGGDFSVCIGTTKTFNAISSTPTTAQAPIASYRWTTPANAVITSATSDSSSITVSFNTGFIGGSLTAKGVTACGVIGTTAATAILQYLPPTPLSISSSTNSYNACINSTVTYTAIVGAPTTAQAPASVFRWTRPNNTSITAASADSSSITVRFNTGYVGGTLSVKGQSRCGTQGGSKSLALTHTGCAVGTKMSEPVTTTINSNSFEVSLYPNPSAGEFKLFVGVTPTKATKATVKVIDLQGRLIKSFECNANQVTALGNELKPGVYMVEVRIGNEVKTLRAVRF
jgi:uncharacterized protein (TIGR02145 family)